MAMIVTTLHKILTEQIAQGHGTRKISVDTGTFPEPNEEDATIAEIKSARAAWIGVSDGDGNLAVNGDGTEHGETMLVLSGEGCPCSANAKGML